MRLKHSRITDNQNDRLTEHFVAGTPARTAAALIEVNKDTAASIYHRLRTVIAENLAAEPGVRPASPVRLSLLSVSQLTVYKGLAWLLALFGQLTQNWPQASLTFIGDGSNVRVWQLWPRPAGPVQLHARQALCRGRSGTGLPGARICTFCPEERGCRSIAPWPVGFQLQPSRATPTAPCTVPRSNVCATATLDGSPLAILTNASPAPLTRRSATSKMRRGGAPTSTAHKLDLHEHGGG